MSCRSPSRSMVRDIKKLFRPKTGMQDPGYVEGVKSACCMLHDILHGCTKYPILKESKHKQIIHNTVDLIHLSLMLKESKVHSIASVLQLYFSCQRSQKSLFYTVDSNMKPSNYSKTLKLKP